MLGWSVSLAHRTPAQIRVPTPRPPAGARLSPRPPAPELVESSWSDIAMARAMSLSSSSLWPWRVADLACEPCEPQVHNWRHATMSMERATEGHAHRPLWASHDILQMPSPNATCAMQCGAISPVRTPERRHAERAAAAAAADRLMPEAVRGALRQDILCKDGAPRLFTHGKLRRASTSSHAYGHSHS